MRYNIEYFDSYFKRNCPTLTTNIFFSNEKNNFDDSRRYSNVRRSIKNIHYIDGTRKTIDVILLNPGVVVYTCLVIKFRFENFKLIKLIVCFTVNCVRLCMCMCIVYR